MKVCRGQSQRTSKPDGNRDRGSNLDLRRARSRAGSKGPTMIRESLETRRNDQIRIKASPKQRPLSAAPHRYSRRPGVISSRGHDNIRPAHNDVQTGHSSAHPKRQAQTVLEDSRPAQSSRRPESAQYRDTVQSPLILSDRRDAQVARRNAMRSSQTARTETKIDIDRNINTPHNRRIKSCAYQSPPSRGIRMTSDEDNTTKTPAYVLSNQHQRNLDGLAHRTPNLRRDRPRTAPMKARSVSVVQSYSARHDPHIDTRCAGPISPQEIFGEKAGSYVLGDSELMQSRSVTADYVLGKQVGTGAYASVRVAVHRPSGRRVALKVYEKHKLCDAQRQKSVRREIRIMERLNHPNIVTFLDAVDGCTQLLVVLELLGVSLHQYLKKRPGRIDQNLARTFFKQVCSGLRYLHNRRVCHRDIKLENCLLDDCGHIKIIDFGFSIVLPAGKKLKVFCGTPSYMAPEVVQRKEYPGFCADIWAAGVLLYAILFGSFPFRGGSDRDLYRKITKGIFRCPESKASDLLHRILDVNMHVRPTVDQVLADLWFEDKAVKSITSLSTEASDSAMHDLVNRMENTYLSSF